MKMYCICCLVVYCKRTGLVQDWFGTPAWLPWRHVKTVYRQVTLTTTKYKCARFCKKAIYLHFLYQASTNSMSPGNLRLFCWSAQRNVMQLITVLPREWKRATPCYLHCYVHLGLEWNKGNLFKLLHFSFWKQRFDDFFDISLIT